MGVMSIRMGKEEEKHVAELAKKWKMDKSTVTRELMEKGWVFFWLKEYQKGRVSMGTLAKKLDMTYTELIDLLSELKIQSPVEFSDYLSGVDVLNR